MDNEQNNATELKPFSVTEDIKNNQRAGAWVQAEPLGDPFYVANHEWVGVDLDGTLSGNHQLDFTGTVYGIGEPVPEMMTKVRQMLAANITVKIFTARAFEPKGIPPVRAWLTKHQLPELEITNQKDPFMVFFYDDRAIQTVSCKGVSVLEAVLGLAGGD
ncbi:MAG: hypothetical protein WCO56_06355 [Verrucomicrobiota bacterium]